MYCKKKVNEEWPSFKTVFMSKGLKRELVQPLLFSPGVPGALVVVVRNLKCAAVNDLNFS